MVSQYQEGPCLVCGDTQSAIFHDGARVCVECFRARGGWEDPRLDQYGRLLKR